MFEHPSIIVFLLVSATACCCPLPTRCEQATSYAAGDDWPYYLGNPAGTHFSLLKDINTSNVRSLKKAWEYDTKDALQSNSTIESNPLVVAGKVYFISPSGRLVSLDGATGHELWVFSPDEREAIDVDSWRRGVSYWTNGKRRRVLFTFKNDLYSVDADTGSPDLSFGSAGKVALGARVSSPGLIYRNTIIVGGISSNIRAFDIADGKLLWTFHTIPRAGEFGNDTWPKDAWRTAIGANNWGGMTLDVDRGIAFAPLGFPQTFHGGERKGDNLFANCIVALDVNSGRRRWHFQTIRHDVWDWDLPAPPTLITIFRDGKRIDALAQVSKVGFTYILDRVTGTPVFPMIEVQAFPSDVPGESMPATQLVPTLPLPFARQKLTSDILTNRTPSAYKAVSEQFSQLRSRGLWDPPSEQGTIVLPGLEGGAEWGGAAYDPVSNSLFVNSNEHASILTLKRLSVVKAATSGSAIYMAHCSGCHGQDRTGRGKDIPSLIGITSRLDFSQLVRKITNGGPRMPGFQWLGADNTKLWGLIEYLRRGIDSDNRQAMIESAAEDIFVPNGNPKFIDPEGYPAIAPPWGTLNSIAPNTGAYNWSIPFGEYPELASKGWKNTGSENYGGPIVTAGGLLFIGATSFDKKFRAYESSTGKLLWETVLPAAGNATPSTYRARGRQFVIIPAGGGRPPTAKSGTKIIAFALPE